LAKRTSKPTRPSQSPVAIIKRYLQRKEYQLALPLAIDLVKQAPTPENHEYLRQCYIWLARSSSPSNAVLQEMLKVPGTNDYWEKLAIAYAEKGNYAQAKAIAERVPGAPALRLVHAHLADWAMTQKPEVAKPLIPAELHAGLDTIQLAYAQYEKKKDDDARETLHAIGISSPWLEWKLLIRGLLAWSTSDNARALENWSRLTVYRLPARFAAPLRQLIDRPYAQSLSPGHRRLVQKQASKFVPRIDELYEIRENLVTDEDLTTAIEHTRRLLPDLRTASPDLPARLTQLFYWEIVAGGQPQDMKLLQRYFPLPTEDQDYYRLQAMVLEQLREFDEVHFFWNKYQNWIEHTPSVWPKKQAQLARAIIFSRMGEAATKWAQPPEPTSFREEILSLTRPNPGKRKPLSPSSLECYEKAFALTPDQPVAAMLLLSELRKTDLARAKSFAKEVRNHFPHHLPTLKALLKFHELEKDPDQILEIVQQLATIDPLDRQWQTRIAQSKFDENWEKATQGDEEALTALEQAVTRMGGVATYQVKGLKAALAFQKGNDELAQQILKEPRRLAETYALVAECIRLKMTKKKWEPFYQSLIEGIKSSSNMPELYPVLELLGLYRNPAHTYRGYTPQAKQLLSLVMESFAASNSIWETTIQMGLALHQGGHAKELKLLSTRYLTSYEDPWRLFFQAEADLMKSKTERVVPRIGYFYWRAHFLITQTKAEMAGFQQYDKLKGLIEERCRKTPEVRQMIENNYS
jgi:tetratricopeptide (TPR) repeat protein